jgi:threonine/homoserine/homoserine lactone efflux protein
MIAFATAFFFLILSPGPGVLSTAGVGSAFGYRPGARYVLGLFLGTNMVCLAVITGVATVVLASPVVRTVLLILSAMYLLYLASKVAFSGSKIAFIKADRAPGIRDALLLQALNPKAYVVNTTMIAGFPLGFGSYWAEIAVKLLIMNAIWIPLHFLWLWFGVALRRLDLAPQTQRKINYAMAGAMVLVVVMALWSLRGG